MVATIVPANDAGGSSALSTPAMAPPMPPWFALTSPAVASAMPATMASTWGGS